MDYMPRGRFSPSRGFLRGGNLSMCVNRHICLLLPIHIFPGFVFATDEQEQEDCIMSMNPVATTDQKYLGTMEEVKAMYGSLPETCIFIANNCTPSQQVELLQIVGKSYVFNDGQGGIASLKDHYWRIMVV